MAIFLPLLVGRSVSSNDGTAGALDLLGVSVLSLRDLDGDLGDSNVPDAAIGAASDVGSKTPDIGQTAWDPILGVSIH